MKCLFFVKSKEGFNLQKSKGTSKFKFYQPANHNVCEATFLLFTKGHNPGGEICSFKNYILFTKCISCKTS